MATVTSTKNGNWSDTTVWDTGTVPVDGDTVIAANHTIQLDVDINQPNTLLTSTGANGYYNYGGTDTRTVVAKADAGTHATGGIIRMSGAVPGVLIFNGPVTGGSGSGAHGAYNTATGTVTVTTATGGSGSSANGAYNNAAGTLTVTTATGGSGSNAFGAYNTATGTLTVTTATGGAGQNAHGANNNAAGTVTVTTATGGSGANAHGAYNSGAGTLTVTTAVGNTGGPGGTTANMSAGVFGSATSGAVTQVTNIVYGAYGAPPTAGSVMIADAPTNSAQFRVVYNGTTKTLVDSAAGADLPTVDNVRSGLVYNNGNLTGTMAVPAAGSVAMGVPVDATTGTATLTAANVRDAVGMATANLDTQLETMDTNIDSILADTGTDGVVVNPRTVEGALDEIEVLRLLLAGMAGKATGGGTVTVTFRDTGDTKDRIVMTVDEDGNRSAVVLDAS